MTKLRESLQTCHVLSMSRIREQSPSFNFFFDLKMTSCTVLYSWTDLNSTAWGMAAFVPETRFSRPSPHARPETRDQRQQSADRKKSETFTEYRVHIPYVEFCFRVGKPPKRTREEESYTSPFHFCFLFSFFLHVGWVVVHGRGRLQNGRGQKKSNEMQLFLIWD